MEFLTQRNIDRYIIRDLNANSAIASPDHDEILDTTKFAPNGTYTVKGYAYAGGGRRVTRVEISSDDGNTWSLANISYPEDLFREVAHFDPTYGDLDLTDSDTCFCWCFWSFDIEISVLKATRGIMVRCINTLPCPHIPHGIHVEQIYSMWNPWIPHGFHMEYVSPHKSCTH
jgi:nitrate reductase (NAD(P)H)